MNNRPWQISTLIFVALTMALWSGLKISIQFKALEPKLVTAVRTASSSAVAQSVPSGVDPAVDAKRTNNQPVQNVFPAPDKSKQPTANLTAILSGDEAKAMQAEIIPKEGAKSPYGMEYSLASFTQQKGWSKSIQVDNAWKDRYEKLATSIYHPCCGVTISTNDCGHAVAGTGLIKKMLQDGKSDQEILTEQMLWQKFYFPRHYVITALAMKKAGQEKGKMDLSKEYSSITSERFASDYLIY